MSTPAEISNLTLIYVSAMCLALAILGHWLEITKAKSIILSVLRALIQLLLIGHILKFVFVQDHLYLNLSLALFMTLASIVTVYSRLENKNLYLFKNIFISIVVVAWPTYLLLAYFIQVPNTFQAATLIPLLGMLLGNSINGITIGIKRVQEDIHERKDYIATMLGLGASWQEATNLLMRSSFDLAITPIINTMMIVGIVSLPGMMTGQIIAGRDPLISAKYQFLILGCIFITIFLGSLIGIYLQLRWYFINHLYFREFMHE